MKRDEDVARQWGCQKSEVLPANANGFGKPKHRCVKSRANGCSNGKLRRTSHRKMHSFARRTDWDCREMMHGMLKNRAARGWSGRAQNATQIRRGAENCWFVADILLHVPLQTVAAAMPDTGWHGHCLVLSFLIEEPTDRLRSGRVSVWTVRQLSTISMPLLPEACAIPPKV